MRTEKYMRYQVERRNAESRGCWDEWHVAHIADSLKEATDKVNEICAAGRRCRIRFCSSRVIWEGGGR